MNKWLLLIWLVLTSCTATDATITASALDDERRIASLEYVLSGAAWTETEKAALIAYRDAVLGLQIEYASAKQRIVDNGLSLDSLSDIQSAAPALLPLYSNVSRLRPSAWAAVEAHRDEFTPIDYAMLTNWHNDAVLLDSAIAELLTNPQSAQAMRILDMAAKAAPIALKVVPLLL